MRYLVVVHFLCLFTFRVHAAEVYKCGPGQYADHKVTPRCVLVQDNVSTIETVNDYARQLLWLRMQQPRPEPAPAAPPPPPEPEEDDDEGVELHRL